MVKMIIMIILMIIINNANNNANTNDNNNANNANNNANNNNANNNDNNTNNDNNNDNNDDANNVKNIFFLFFLQELKADRPDTDEYLEYVGNDLRGWVSQSELGTSGFFGHLLFFLQSWALRFFWPLAVFFTELGTCGFFL